MYLASPPLLGLETFGRANTDVMTTSLPKFLAFLCKKLLIVFAGSYVRTTLCTFVVEGTEGLGRMRILNVSIDGPFPLLTFFLICRRARRQRSQSPILVTVRIDEHFKLYIDWSLSGKSKSSQLASQVMESTSKFLLIAQSAIKKAATVQSSCSRTATTHDCKNLQKWNHRVATNCTCRRDFNC